MSGLYTLYGWHLSYFTGKAMCYLRYKQLPFEQKAVDMATLMWRIKRKTGAAVMPVLVTPEGEWINDTSRIIDHVEARVARLPVHPATPVQRFASHLMEAWGDEWWVPLAMHTRWTYPENYALFERDAGAALLPYLPGFVQRRAVNLVAKKLRAMLHGVGVRPAQFSVMDAWMLGMLDLLDAHFEQHRFLFGERPTLGDFGLVGTMYGHLGRDPWPARELIAPRPHLRAWIDRMAEPVPAQGLTPPALQADDQIPLTLVPVFQAIAREFLPLLEGINAQVKAKLLTWPAGQLLPRGLADVEVPMGHGLFRRAALPYTLWMAQRTLDVFRSMEPSGQQQVRAWLASIGGEHLLALDIPRLRLHGVRVAACAAGVT
ncbi:glutathione S-transferase family protein [Roseateles sp.]|uniref:glutathione S-transferase family protein n=1 Tax=Roseateles sp. TaxID=1971397 RepID=UPI003BABFB10